MSAHDARRRARIRARRACALLAALALAGTLLVLLGALPVPWAAPRAAALPPFAPGEATTPQVDGGMPALQVTMLGATPEESGAPGADETWGVGLLKGKRVLVRYYLNPGGGNEGTWTLGPDLPSSFEPVGSPLAGRLTPDGYGVLLGTGKPGTVLVRKPGGPFEATQPITVESESPVPGEETLLKREESLWTTSRAPMVAPLAEAGGEAGALVVPFSNAETAVEKQVLHWNGHEWSSERIEVPASSEENFRVLAIGASSPTNAWLLVQLARSGFPAGSVALFERTQSAGEWSWKPVGLEAPGDAEAHPLNVPVAGGETKPFTVFGTGFPPTVKAQLLTVTERGVWVDGRRTDVTDTGQASTTLFVKPEGERSATVQASWCQPQGGGAAGCGHTLPEALPSALSTGYSNSVAWPGGGPFGSRVIAGGREGVSLRLEGETFSRVLAMGAGMTAEEHPGSRYGAAFSSPTEGWLGEALLPVHLTEKPVSSRLTPWPVTVRTPLLAVAPQPGAPVGAISSEALAVGYKGAVSRYKPGQGWLPESLFAPGQRSKETPVLRSVAWPTSSRAYAVGDHGQMWLWRGETGLWEKDPATPVNFRGNLVGVAFDPNNAYRGYAVGTTEVGLGGVLLRFGKTWTEETALPPQAQGAAFTSIAFAGSEAIVAYRKQPNPNVQSFVGGLLVNDGSGWRVDEEAANALGGAVPVTVAGLPDGGAAVMTDEHRLFERQGPGGSWQATAVPPPGDGSSLTLFREGGALRAIVAGGGVGNLSTPTIEPPGTPPAYYNPIGVFGVGPETAVVLRQGASGWSDESHELDPIAQPEGGYKGVAGWDMPYRPDPVNAVLVDPSGAHGWAVGGFFEGSSELGHGLLDTADIERYPADGEAPAGVQSSAEVPLMPGQVTLAIGGHAECANPCADRARAGVGPQVWLSSALALTRKIGVPFVYTGPSMSKAETEAAERSVPLFFSRELERVASILAPSANAAPAYVVPSAPDRDARPESAGGEATFQSVLHAEIPGESGTCATEPNCTYYALPANSSPGVRTIVLDDGSEVGSAQMGWLEAELQNAKAAGEPAIAIGEADLNARIAAGQGWAKQLASLLVNGPSSCKTGGQRCGASAYFYDAPEEDVHRPLQSGGASIEAFGSGTLGYVRRENEVKSDFHGASGVMLSQVAVAQRDPLTNVAPVTVRLIPVIGELGIEPKSGVLLRRSQPALFAGLARRPRAGDWGVANSNESTETDPYIPIPEECLGAACPVGLFPEYTFTSENKDVGAFVKRNTAAANSALAVLQNEKGEPINDEPEPGKPLAEAESGLFCAFNKGETKVTISAGGLSTTILVRVQPGSVRQPCGTVPLKNLPAAEQAAAAPVPPPPAPAPAGPAPAASPTPVAPVPPLPPAPAPVPPPAPHAPSPFFLPPTPIAPLLAFVPPPVPTPARPTPPSGTSPVTSPVEMAEHEDEEEEATESVSNQAVAYRAHEHEPSPAYILGIVLLAALAGASIVRPRRGRSEVRVAPATISSMRSQRRNSGRPGGRR